MYREIIAATQKQVSITLPEALVGKTVEVFAFEIQPLAESRVNEVASKNDFWDTFGSGKNTLMTSNQVREKAWRKYKW